MLAEESPVLRIAFIVSRATDSIGMMVIQRDAMRYLDLNLYCMGDVLILKEILIYFSA